MPTYLIGYDLHAGEDYTDLEEAIRQISGRTYWHNLDSTWIIRHPGKASVIRDALLPYLIRPDEPATSTKRRGDKLLVVKLSGEGAWTLSFGERACKWLKSYL